MSALVELQDRLQSTNALIAQYEQSVAEIKGDIPRSLLANIRALDKLKKRLEAEYLEVASQLELEVYRYRILNDDRVTLASVAEAWSKFQTFFSSVYSALTTRSQKKKPPQPQHIELGYGYSFAGSVGVVVTVPRDVGIYATSPLEEASTTVFDLIEARNLENNAKILGPAPIQALHDWVDVHIKHHYGLGLEWRSENQVKRQIEIQYQSLIGIQGTIADTTTRVVLDVLGELVAVDSETREFKLKGDNGQEYSGTFESAITAEHAASVPSRYNAKIILTTKLIVLGKQPESTYFLEALEAI